MKTHEEIYEELKPLLAGALGVELDRIRPESVLVKDLGAESIDLLDLSFRIEEKFHVTIEANEIEREAKQRMPGGVYEENGVLTEQALEEIRKAAPGLDPTKLVTGLRKSDLPSLLTVDFFVHLITRKLAAKTEGTAHA